jgi:hypothetical protein
MNKYRISFDPYNKDRYDIFLRSQSIKKIFKGEQVDKSHEAYKKSKWYTPITNIAYTEYLSDMLDKSISYSDYLSMLDKSISYSDYLSSNMYVDTSNTIIFDSNYSTY